MNFNKLAAFKLQQNQQVSVLIWQKCLPYYNFKLIKIATLQSNRVNRMEHKRGSKFQSIISAQSRRSVMSFSKSLGRPSWQLKDVSLGKNASLIYVMSIEGDNRKSDIFERLLQTQKKPKSRNSTHIAYNQFNLDKNYQFFPQDNQMRNSDVGAGNENQIQIDHECNCYDSCFGYRCPCFQAKNQMCIKGTCCNKCVEIKIGILQGNHNLNNSGNMIDLDRENSQNTNLFNNTPQAQPVSCNCKNTQCLKSYCKCFQNGELCSEKCGCQACKNKINTAQRQIALQAIKSNNQVIYCTCKKTKCNKKYCSCYAQGIKCGKHCSCENCVNCQKVNAMDIQLYEGQEEEDYRNLQMPERMSFQPVVFE